MLILPVVGAMTNIRTTSLRVALAVSTAATLGSTSIIAQEVAGTPVIVLPETLSSPPPAAVPTVVLPSPLALEDTETTPAPAVTVTRETNRSLPVEPAPVRAAVTAASDPVIESAPAEGATIAPPIAADPATQPVAGPAEEAPQRNSVAVAPDFPDELAVAGLLGLLGLGGAALVARRARRRKLSRDHDEAAVPIGTASVTPVAVAQPAQVVANRSAPTMPIGAVAAGDERSRLIERMVAAAPDEANPFTSAKARRKRARIILQAREHEIGQQPQAPFDWRTYRSSTDVDPVSPPRVDA